jgi:hypothetical protein
MPHFVSQSLKGNGALLFAILAVTAFGSRLIGARGENAQSSASTHKFRIKLAEAHLLVARGLALVLTDPPPASTPELASTSSFLFSQVTALAFLFIKTYCNVL